MRPLRTLAALLALAAFCIVLSGAGWSAGCEPAGGAPESHRTHSPEAPAPEGADCPMSAAATAGCVVAGALPAATVLPAPELLGAARGPVADAGVPALLLPSPFFRPPQR